MTTIDKQRCTTCREWLPVSEFTKKGKHADGRQMYVSDCKLCEVERARNMWVNTGMSGCTRFPMLDECQAIVWTGHALPCNHGQYTPPSSAQWRVRASEMEIIK